MKHSRHRPKRSNRKKYVIVLVSFVVIILLTYLGLAIARPLSDIDPSIDNPSLFLSTKLQINWPLSSGAAIGVQGYGLIDSNNGEIVSPTASIAKLVTALAVLSKDPLPPGQTIGPELTMTQADVNDYNAYVAEGGSVVKIVVGEQLSEYQALQAMLLPSANNIADTLATWAFGSISNYTTFANKFILNLGLTHTTIADASGFSPSTTSTPDDLILLGEQALNNKIIAQIVNQKTAKLPVVGTINNVDFFLGDDSIIGIKTGNTDQAGGCFLAAASYTMPNNQNITVITSILKAPTLQAALNESVALLQSVKDQIITKTIPAGSVVASYETPWGSRSNVVTKSSISAAYLPGMKLNLKTVGEQITIPVIKETTVGSTILTGSNVQSLDITSSAIRGPSIIWRLEHPKNLI